MSGRHATPAELELYVMGALDADRSEAFEAATFPSSEVSPRSPRLV